MEQNNFTSSDYLFEVSWEVCNKVGGIHTVVATKALNLSNELQDRHILIGPDVWMDTEQNPEFLEDDILFRTWRVSAAEDGLRIRVGRWNVAGSPIAILVDFSTFISKKDAILTELWQSYGVDSLSGQWDYVESVLFGYAAGKVIESFSKFNLSSQNHIIAQFHEWMTGSGLLYLKGLHLPIATVFTTHATVVGRCLACNNVPLYDELSSVNAEEKARYFNVMAKHSIEKCAAKNANIFTTVSDITARECSQFLGREVDFITPNGFENTFTPEEDEFAVAEDKARKKLIEVAQMVTNESYDNPLLISIGGRYEYRNKGIDVFIDSLDKINRSEYNGRTILAFLMIPTGNNGPCREVGTVTHYLQDSESDTILNKLKSVGLNRAKGIKVKVIYVPTYLNGNDGIFNMSYYNLLVGMDLTLFPSYYEPWGYTPLESLAFKVPTVTTSFSGFGLWVEKYYKGSHPSIEVVERNDINYQEVVENTCAKILEIAALSPEQREMYKENAKSVSEIALWDNNIVFYKKAYSSALDSLSQDMSSMHSFADDHHTYKSMPVNKPTWNRVLVTRHIPKRLEYLDIISKNLWWCWNESAMDLFKSIDAKMWLKADKNPIALLDMISLEQYRELEKNEKFLDKLDRVAAEFNGYMEGKKSRKGAAISYFCMEYGLDTSLKIYSGGLGILAGDYLKESSDMMVNMTGIGLLYRYGYFTQKLTAYGDQVADYEPQHFLNIPATPVRDSDGKWLTVSVAFPGRNIYARLWRVDVGRTELYLLDTDFEDNLPEDRQVTYHLYGGDWENRLKQELLLGIGGIRALRLLGIHTDVYHCNEGHAAFIGLERLREYVSDENLSYREALEVVRASSLFTTHTPVPAGHDAFSEDMLRTYLPHYPSKLKIDWSTMMSLGKINPDDPNEKFSMSNLACNLSQEVNGVSWLHGKVSQDILSGLWPGYLPEELHVSYVTNGVHHPTWTAPQWKEIQNKAFGDSFRKHDYDKKCFEGIFNVRDYEIWSVRSELRAKLMKEVKRRISSNFGSNHYSPKDIVTIKETLRDDILTIGFARRFATYKRAHLLFRDLERLDQIINNEAMPVQFIFAGKAHPADKAGQDLIKRIVEISKMPQFIGKIVFVPNYDINLAKAMVQGVDIWMNTPTRPLEASGTSGEKAAMNGVMHFSVLDGWWVEGYQKGAGWALPMERTYDEQNFQDELDAATIYNIIENDIAPIFYNRSDNSTLPVEWINIIKNNIAYVASNFTTNRMLKDYIDKFYNPLFKRYQSLIKDNYAVAKQIAFWKKRMRRGWKHLEVLDFNHPSDNSLQFLLGQSKHTSIKVFVGDIDPKDVGVEIIYSQQDRKGRYIKKGSFSYKLEDVKDGVATYTSDIVPSTTGVYQIAARIFAKNDLLPHRQDFELVRWL